MSSSFAVGATVYRKQIHRHQRNGQAFDEMHGYYYEFQATLSSSTFYVNTDDHTFILHFTSSKRGYSTKTQYRKFETHISRKGIAWPQSQFPHSCVSFSDFYTVQYSQDGSAYSAAGKYVDRSWEYINRSQTHECGNWDRGRAIPYLGIHSWDFRCSV
jgi:hypothetical protein